MLTFHITESGKAIQILMDKDGAATLRLAIDKIEREGTHVHLRTPGAGGRQLDELSPFGEPSVSEVVMTFGGD